MSPIVELLVAWFTVILEGIFIEERKSKLIKSYIPFEAIIDFYIATNGDVWGVVSLSTLWVIACIVDDIIKETSQE